MLRGSFTSTLSTHGMKTLTTDRADQLRHSSLPPFEFAETTSNMVAATKQQPTTAYRTFRTFMTALQPGRANFQKSDARSFWLPASIPASCQPRSPAISAPNQPHNQQQNQGANGGVDDRGDRPRTQVNAELRQEPTSDESAGHSDNEIAFEPEARALHDLTCKPSGNEANNKYDQQTFTRHVHRRVPWIHRERTAARC